MLVVGSASTTPSLSITLSEASDPTFIFSASSSFLPSLLLSFLALKPHLVHTMIDSSPGLGFRRVSHLGQKRKIKTSLLFDGRFDHVRKLLGIFYSRGRCILNNFHGVFSLCCYSHAIFFGERVLQDDASKVHAFFLKQLVLNNV